MSTEYERLRQQLAAKGEFLQSYIGQTGKEPDANTLLAWQRLQEFAETDDLNEKLRLWQEAVELIQQSIVKRLQNEPEK